MQASKTEIKKPILIFLAAKTFTWISLLLSSLAVYGTENFLYKFKHAVINWDAIWYLKIAAEGYDTARKCAFFPLMPLLTKITSFAVPDFAWAGLLLSFISGLAGVIYFYALCREHYGEKTAVTALVLFLAAPTAVFYASLYTEPLFFFLVAACFYHTGKKQWLIAAVFAGLASATRNFGILLVVPILWEYFLGVKKGLHKSSPMQALYIAVISCSGLAAYMAYLQVTHNDAFMFVRATQTWEARSFFTAPFLNITSRLGDLPGFFAMKLSETKTNLSFLYFISAIALAIWGFKKIRYSHWLFLILNLFVLSIQPGLMSISRYVSVIFAVWVLAAVLINERRSAGLWAFAATACFLIWQAYVNFRWIAGYWVA